MKSKIVILDDSVLLYQNYIENDSWEKVLAYARGGLTYLIQNNGIRFFASHDWLYKNLIASLELPLYIIDEESGIDGEYDDIQQITEILNSIFPSANGDTDLRPYLKKREAEELYQPIGDYLTKESGDTIYQPIGDYVTDDELSEVLDDYYTKEESDEKYQPTGDYLSANSLVGYATEQWVENKGYIDKIKTINNQSLIGEGNIEISGGTVDAYTKAEADNRFQPKGDYVSRTTFITYITNLTQQIESLQDAIEECCSGSGETLYRWITLTGPNDYVCSGTSKYTKEQKQQSTDNGATWQNVSPAEYRAGILIETDSPDCGYEPVIEYRWVTVSGEYVCSGTTKYNKEKKQYRVDGGDWIDTSPLQTRRGSIVIETQSPDCGYVPPQYRWWQAPASDYICSGTTKYYKEYYQVSYDGGSTWQNVSPEQTRRGAVIESQSTDCGYIEPQYRWYQAPATDYICSGTTKYYKEYYQASYDGGSTWQNVSPEQTRRGSVIEYQSTDCGYIPAPKLTVVDTNNRTKTINCDGSPELTRQEVPGYTPIKTAVVGDCVTSLYETFWGETYLSGVTLPNTLERIGRAAFEDCTNLTGITIPDSVKYLGSGMGGGAFANSGLKSIVLPKVRYLYGGSFAGCTSLSSVTFGTQSYISFDISDFSGCTSLTSINITPDVYQLGGNTFKGCTNLQSITFSGLKQVPYIKSLVGGTYETFDDTNNCPIYVPANLLSDIKSADGWKQYKDRIQAIP